MTGPQLATLSTWAWIFATGTLFLVLASWSAGESSWTILPGVLRGVRDWTAAHAAALANTQPTARWPGGSAASRPRPGPAEPGPGAEDELTDLDIAVNGVEIEELYYRHIDL